MLKRLIISITKLTNSSFDKTKINASHKPLITKLTKKITIRKKLKLMANKTARTLRQEKTLCSLRQTLSNRSRQKSFRKSKKTITRKLMLREKCT